MKMKLTLVLSILSAARVGAQTPIFRGECRVTVVEYLCTEDVLGEQCDHTRLTCDDSEGFIHDVLGPSSEEIMEMVDAGIIQSTVSVFNPNDEETVSFDGENVIIDMSNGFSLENLSITQGNYPTMSPKKGDIQMLLVLIDALDYDVTYTASKLSSDVFGTNDDHEDEVNVSSQFRACSANALRINPGKETSMTAPGTIRVDINMNLNNSGDSAILNAAITAAEVKLGFSPLRSRYQNVYFAKNGCYEFGQGPGCGYGAYAGINSWYSMYPSAYITFSAIQGHEHGHNLGLYHSGESSSTYGDHSCKMGNPLYGDELGKMCFNPAKSWFLEWYPGSGELVFDKNTDSVMHKKLVGAGEWENPNQGQVVIKIENGDKDLFVGFNRAAGANSQNDEFDDEVTVIEAKNSNTVSGQSYIKAHLKNGEEYTQNSVTVKVCDLKTNVVPGYAKIVIYNPSKNNGSCENESTDSPTSVPTGSSPTKPCADDPNFVKSRGDRQRTCQYIKDGRDHRRKKWCNKRKGGKLIKEFCCKTCESF